LLIGNYADATEADANAVERAELFIIAFLPMVVRAFPVRAGFGSYSGYVGIDGIDSFWVGREMIGSTFKSTSAVKWIWYRPQYVPRMSFDEEKWSR
jgi:hypothetical protein